MTVGKLKMMLENYDEDGEFVQGSDFEFAKEV